MPTWFRHGAALRDIRLKLDTIIHQGTCIMTELESLAAEVARDRTVDESAITLLVGLAAQIAAANAISPAAVHALADQLKSQTDALAAAVAANTPAGGVV